MLPNTETLNIVEKESYIILNELVNKDLQLEDGEALAAGEEMPDLNLFHERLKNLVSYLLDHDMHRLLNAMYRLDVSEARFHDAMQAPDKEEAASRIADLVIEREMQKIKTRLHYKKYRNF